MDKLDMLCQAAKLLNVRCEKNVPLKKFTSFKIGGPAEVLMTAENKRQLCEIVKVCKELQIEYLVIGKGSNLLISDDGIEGAVICLTGDFEKIELVDETTVLCSAAVSLKKLCKFALDNSLSGLEFAWGIPGSAGGAAFMNAGAYGGEMKDVLTSCNHVTRDGECGCFTADEMELSYRHSIYQDKKYVITELYLKLKRDDAKLIKARMDDYLQRRKDKQPLEYPSAGSVFKRPEGNFAGTLIEKSGLKGKTIGGAQVSEKHAGFIINTGNATCSDVLQLVEYIQQTVKDDHCIELECEIKKIGKN